MTTLSEPGFPADADRWPSAAAVISAAELLYSSSAGPELGHRRVRDVLKSAGAQFYAAGRFDELFELLAVLRLPYDLMDAKLFHLRSAALIHEHHRIKRVRKFLLYALLSVLIYLFCISPSVFIALENPYRIAHGMGSLDWSEGLYWSVITATTVGYGDLVPQTPYARMFALFDASLGVTLMGCVAGLILGWVTPKRLN
jgi:voltage-gated potassium channel